MGRRRVTRYAELTSLLDVLFIMLFAALIQAAGVVEGAAKQEPEKEPAPQPPLADAGPTDAGPSPSHQALRKRALEELMRSMGDRQVIYVRVNATGILTAVERQAAGGAVQKQILEVPLLEPVADPDVAVVYSGDRSGDLRLCSRVRVTLGLSDLSDRLIVVVTEAPLAELPIALVDGMRRDQERCYIDERGIAVLVPP